MPVLACPKCGRPFCVEPTEEALQQTLANLRVMLKGKRVVQKKRTLLGKIKRKVTYLTPPKGIECAFCSHRFRIEQAVRIT